MPLNEHELIHAYQDLIKAYPEDMRIARPLIQMLQARGDIIEARDLAMSMARRMVALGYSSYALAFLSICEQLEHPNADEIESMKTMAELTLGSPPQTLSEVGDVFELIEALSDSESKNFLTQGAILKVKAGGEIVKQGEVSQSFYLILEGEVHIYINTKAGAHIEVGKLKPGGFFGEAACVYRLPRTATVVAFSDTELLEFSDATVDEMMHASPIAGDSLMKVVQRRMVETISFMHPAFTNLAEEDRLWLEAESELVEYLPNQDIKINNDADNPFFYVLVFGKMVASRVDVTKCGLGVNAVYGHARDVLKFPEVTTLQASERCLVCKVPIQIFDTLYKTYGGFEHWINSHVSKRNEALAEPATSV